MDRKKHIVSRLFLVMYQAVQAETAKKTFSFWWNLYNALSASNTGLKQSQMHSKRDISNARQAKVSGSNF